MPWLRRWRRKHGRPQATVNAPTFRELFERQQRLRAEQSLSPNGARPSRPERQRDLMEDAIVNAHFS